MRYGKDRSKFQKLSMQGKSTPLEKEPELDDSLREIFELFILLANQRTVGFSSVNPIAIPDIFSVLDLYGITDEDERTKYFEFIIELDRFQRTNANNQRSSKQ